MLTERRLGSDLKSYKTICFTIFVWGLFSFSILRLSLYILPKPALSYVIVFGFFTMLFVSIIYGYYKHESLKIAIPWVIVFYFLTITILEIIYDFWILIDDSYSIYPFLIYGIIFGSILSIPEFFIFKKIFPPK